MYLDDKLDLNLNMAECEELFETLEAIKREKKKVEHNLDNFKGDRSIIEQFKDRLWDYKSQQKIFKDCADWELVIKQDHDTLKKKRTDEFNSGLYWINHYLRNMFREITLGGDATLEVKDQFDPFSEGVSFSVKPLNKSWKEIHQLSGGE